MDFNLSNPFKDLSLQGQASNPLQLLFNPMAVGTVGLSMAKQEDNKTGWFSNLFKPKTKNSDSINANGSKTLDTTTEPANDNKTLYIIVGIVIVIIIIGLMLNKKPTP